jgi:PKD repeat protein
MRLVLALRAWLSSLLLSIGLAAALPTAIAHGAGWAPAPDEVIPAGPAPLSPAAVVMRGDGALTALWLQGSGAPDLMVADRPPGGPWGASRRLSGGAGVIGGTIVANASGAQAAAWLEAGYVRAATRAPGGAWDPVAVPLSGAGVGNPPAVTIAPDGTIAVAWIESAAVQVSVRGTAGAFSAPVTLPSGTNPIQVDVAAGPSSDLLVAWSDTNGVQTRIMTAYRPAGGPSFKTPVAAAAATPSAGASLYMLVPQIAFDPNGEATVVWMRTIVDPGAGTTTTHWEGKWRTAGTAGTFQGALPHDLETRTINSTLPSGLFPGVLVADASGRTSFVWPALATTGGLDMASRDSGSGFGATQSVTTSGSPRLWGAAAGSNLVILDNKVSSVAFAGPGAPLGPFDAGPMQDAGAATRGVVAGDPSGDAAITWATTDGTNYHLRATVYDATPPEARDVAVPTTATAGAPAVFSVTPWDALTAATAMWDFGDGTTATGASVQHAYATPGDRTVTVTVTDQGGNAVTATRTVGVAAPPGTPPAGPKTTAPPVLSAVRLTRSRFAVARSATPLTGKAKAAARRSVARGTALRWHLSAAATLRVTVRTAASHGHRARTVGTLRRTARAGAGKLAFSGRIGKRALTPGRYTLTVVATDAAGHASKTVSVRFTVVRAG